MRCSKYFTILFLIISIFIFPHDVKANNVGGGITFDDTPVIQGVGIGANLNAILGNLILSGYTSPNSVVTFMVEGNVIGTQVACPGGTQSECSMPGYSGVFAKSFSGLAAGSYYVSIYSVDTLTPSLTTPTINRFVTVLQGNAASPDMMTLPPTIKTNTATVKRTQKMTLSGRGRPNAKVRTFFNNANPFPEDHDVTNDGDWSVESPIGLPLGNNFATAIIQGTNGAISEQSKIVTFRVLMTADLNDDGLVDLLDFSMLMFNYGENDPVYKPADINDDGIVDLVDFSIMMFNWSGV